MFDLWLVSWHVDKNGEKWIITGNRCISQQQLLYSLKKKKGSRSVTKELKLNNGFSTSSSRIYIFASWIIHVLHTCHALINVTYIEQKNHRPSRLKGNDQFATNTENIRRSIELLNECWIVHYYFNQWARITKTKISRHDQNNNNIPSSSVPFLIWCGTDSNCNFHPPRHKSEAGLSPNILAHIWSRDRCTEGVLILSKNVCT